MSKVVAAVLFVAVVGVACSLDPLASTRDKVVSHVQHRETLKTKQSAGCSFPANYPEKCKTATPHPTDLHSSIINPEDTDFDDLDAALNVVCTSECMGQVVEYWECLGKQDFADYYNTGLCGQSDGTNCIVLWGDGVNSQSVVHMAPCKDSGTCDSSCRDSLQATVDYLGCCAASLYDNPLSPYTNLIASTEFAMCNVDLGEKCEGIVDSSAPETNFSRAEILGLLTVFATVAAIINAVI